MCHSFYIYFLSYNTLQNIVGSHHTIYDEAWAGWRLWVESVDFLGSHHISNCDEAWAGCCFSMEPVVFKVTVSSGIFWPSSPTGTRTCNPHIRGSSRAMKIMFIPVTGIHILLVPKPNSWTYNFVEVSEGIILRVLRLEVSVRILKPWGRGYGFLSGFPPFSFTV